MSQELISIDDVKSQCYLDDEDTSDDNYISLLISASISYIENYTNRQLFAVGADIPTDIDNGLYFTDDIKIAALLLIGGWNENREEMTASKVHSIPFGFHAIVSRHKFISM